MFHRHPFLSLVTFAYLGFVAWLTLTPDLAERDEWSLVLRVVDRLQRVEELSWLTYDRAEALANVALFVPVGLFFLLLVGTRFWWVAFGLGIAMTLAIETAQRSIPGRVPDARDLLTNTTGTVIGVVVGVVLTAPAALRRARRRRDAPVRGSRP